MLSNISPIVYEAFNRIIAMIGTSFSLKKLIEYVEVWRGKNLHIESDIMPPGMSGYCVPLLDLDLICTRFDLDSVLELITALHEISHLLLGHIDQYPKGKLTVSYAVFIQRRDQETLIYRQRYYDTIRSIEREQDAETLATLLLECVHRSDDELPDIVRNLHGWFGRSISMSLVFIAQYIAFAFSVPIAVVVGYRAYTYRDHERNMPIVWLSLGALLIFLGQGTALLAAYFIWMHLITSIAVYSGVLLVYWGLRNLIYKEPPEKPLTSNTIFKIFLLLTITTIILNIGRIITWVPTDKESSLHYPVELDVWPPFYWIFNTSFYFMHDFIQFLFIVLIIVIYTYFLFIPEKYCLSHSSNSLLWRILHSSSWSRCNTS